MFARSTGVFSGDKDTAVLFCFIQATRELVLLAKVHAYAQIAYDFPSCLYKTFLFYTSNPRTRFAG